MHLLIQLFSSVNLLGWIIYDNIKFSRVNRIVERKINLCTYAFIFVVSQ